MLHTADFKESAAWGKAKYTKKSENKITDSILK